MIRHLVFRVAYFVLLGGIMGIFAAVGWVVSHG